MALHNATHLLVQQGLALVISRRRAAYVRYRELWVLSATAHLVWILLTSAAWETACGTAWNAWLAVQPACGNTHVEVGIAYRFTPSPGAVTTMTIAG